MASVRLTGWPPARTAFQALLAAAAMVPCGLWFAWVAVPDYHRDPDRIIAVGVIFAIPALLLFTVVMRLALRWIVRPSMRIEDGELVVRVRRRRLWLFDRMEETRLPIAQIRSLRFETALRAAFTIEAEGQSVVVPPAQFAIGPHSLDAVLRTHLPHDRFPDPLAEVPVLIRFGLSRTTTWIMRVILLLPFVLVLVGVVSGNDMIAVVAVLFYLPWLAIAWLAIESRGEILLDARGVFHEYDGIVAFIAWPELDPDSISITSRGFNKVLELRSARRVRGEPTRLRMTRMFGLGRPLADIGEAVELVGAKYR